MSATLDSGPSLGGTFPVNGRAVPRLGYGLGRLAVATTDETRRDAIALLHQAYDVGVRQFDTAHFYGDGLANDLLQEAFSDRRDDVIFATKSGARSVPGAPIPLTLAQRPEDLRAEVEANLVTLGTDHLDVVYLRRADYLPGLLATGDQVVPIEDQLAELSRLRDEGKIIDIGLSHVTEEQVRAALPLGVVSVQNNYHLLGREFEPLLELCRDHGIAWTPYFPLGGGGYAGLPKVTADPAVRAVAAELDATPSQVGLAWQLAHAPNTMLIPGTADLQHLRENLAAGDLVLDQATLARLETRAG